MGKNKSRIYERTELLVTSLFLLNTLLPKLFSSSVSMASSSSGESSWTSSLSSAQKKYRKFIDRNTDLATFHHVLSSLAITFIFECHSIWK